MKTFRHTSFTYMIRSSALFTKLTLTIAALFLVLSQTIAQNKKPGKIAGFVVDDEFNTPLEKAVVTIPGTLISVLTDQQGKFSMTLIGGDYTVEVNYPGYFRRMYNMSVYDEISTPMFIIKLKANAVGRAMQRRITSLENKREFPQTIEDFSTWQVTEQNGNQEFNQLLRTIPSATLQSNGSGYSDSQVGFRGNAPDRTSYSFNGILLNNPETGTVGSSLLSGLTDWAGQIQVTAGQAANLQSQTNSGALINVLTYVPHEKAGADLLAVYGNEGYLKTSATVHSGLSKKGWASSVQLSRTTGNGLVQNTAFEQYAFFTNIQKEFNHRHTLVLNLNGVIQQHDRNPSDSIGAYNLYGTKYNRQWGYLNEKPLSWSTNYGRSPLISLTHFWQPRIKTHVTTQIFALFNRSGQLIEGDPNISKNDSLPRNLEGQRSYALIVKNNNSLTDTLSPLHARIDRENRFGLRSVITHSFSKKFDLTAAISLEHYHASHFGAIHDSLGTDGYTSFSDLNRPEGFAFEKLFGSGFFQSYNSPKKTDYSYESSIQTGGFSLRTDYRLDRFYWYLNGTASLQRMQRIDHFSYLETDPARKSESILLPAGQAQTGFRLNLWKYHSVHLRGGYGSYQSLFSVLFPSGNNWKNQQATNEQIFDAGIGYTIFSRRLKVEALAYRSQITNRSMVRRSNLHPGDAMGLINGLEELHQGVELKTSYKVTRNFQFYLNGSLGNWIYTKDASASIYNSGNQLTRINELWLKNIKTANAPQLSIFAEAEWRWAHNFYVRLNYYRADQIYAPFGLYDFQNLANRSDFEQWKLPKYELLGCSGNYLLKVSKTHTLNLIFGAQNLLDTEYIEQSGTNWNEENPHYTANQVYYGTGRTWFAGIKYQF